MYIRNIKHVAKNRTLIYLSAVRILVSVIIICKMYKKKPNKELDLPVELAFKYSSSHIKNADVKQIMLRIINQNEVIPWIPINEKWLQWSFLSKF